MSPRFTFSVAFKELCPWIENCMIVSVASPESCSTRFSGEHARYLVRFVLPQRNIRFPISYFRNIEILILVVALHTRVRVSVWRSTRESVNEVGSVEQRFGATARVASASKTTQTYARTNKHIIHAKKASLTVDASEVAFPNNVSIALIELEFSVPTSKSTARASVRPSSTFFSSCGGLCDRNSHEVTFCIASPTPNQLLRHIPWQPRAILAQLGHPPQLP